jgi:hypothetical protein
MLIIFCFFFETKYLFAMNSGKFKVLCFEIKRIIQLKIEYGLRFYEFIDVVNIIKAIIDIEFQFWNYAQ